MVNQNNNTMNTTDYASIFILIVVAFCGLLVAKSVRRDNEYRKNLKAGDRCRVTFDWDDVPGTITSVLPTYVVVLLDDGEIVEVDRLLIHRP